MAQRSTPGAAYVAAAFLSEALDNERLGAGLVKAMERQGYAFVDTTGDRRYVDRAAFEEVLGALRRIVKAPPGKRRDDAIARGLLCALGYNDGGRGDVPEPDDQVSP